MVKKERKPWRLNGLVTSAIRKIWSRSPLKLKALELALVNPEAKRYDYLYKCSRCGETFPLQKVEVNHISGGFTAETWDEFISRIFCYIEGVTWEGDIAKYETIVGKENLEIAVSAHLEVVCKVCHVQITKAQRAEAKKVKRGGK